MTTPPPDREDLMAWIDGEATTEHGRDIQQHLDACTTCAGVVDQLRAQTSTLAAWTVETPPTSLTTRVREAAREAREAGTPVSPWRSPRLRWLALAAMVVLAIVVPLRMQCVEASSMCQINRMRQFLGGGSDRAATSMGAATTSGHDVRDHVALRVPGASLAPIPAGNEPKAVVTMFVDWQCPACRAAHENYAPMFDDFERSAPGAVKFVVKDFPLNSACNPGVSIVLHPAACEAAVAVRLARENGRDREMIQWLFANQEGLKPDGVKAEVASLLGITDFDARYVDEIEHVRADANEGVGLHVGGTPACYLNGVLINDAGGRSLPVSEVRRLIEAELAKAR